MNCRQTRTRPVRKAGRVATDRSQTPLPACAGHRVKGRADNRENLGVHLGVSSSSDDGNDGDGVPILTGELHKKLA